MNRWVNGNIALLRILTISHCQYSINRIPHMWWRLLLTECCCCILMDKNHHYFLMDTSGLRSPTCLLRFGNTQSNFSCFAWEQVCIRSRGFKVSKRLVLVRKGERKNDQISMCGYFCQEGFRSFSSSCIGALRLFFFLLVKSRCPMSGHLSPYSSCLYIYYNYMSAAKILFQLVRESHSLIRFNQRTFLVRRFFKI